MTMIYYEEDADLTALKGKTVGVIGYGQLGRPVALNLRDSGVEILVGGTAEEQSDAEAEDFPTDTIAGVTQQVDILMLMQPDDVMTPIYMADISPHLTRGDSLIFASAYNVASGFIEPPPFVDVGLVAPRTAGPTLRQRYVEDKGFLSFVAVWQDASGHTWNTVLAIAQAVGSLRMGAVEVSIEQEAEISRFIEQAILPTLYHVLITGAQLLIEQGYPPDAVLLDLYLSGKFNDYVQRIARSGLLQTLRQTPMTAQYGTFSRLDRFSELKLERLMEVTLEEIRSDEFSREWSSEHADGYPRLKKLLKQQESLTLWELEQQTLEMFENL